MKFRLPFLAAAWLAVPLLSTNGAAADLPTRSPFGITVTAAQNASGSNVLRVAFTMPVNCVINVDRLHFRTTEGADISPRQIPSPELEVNPLTGKTNAVYPHDFLAEVNPADLPDQQLVVKFQGCTNGECYFPEQRRFAPNKAKTYAEVKTETPAASSPAGATDWNQAFQGFTVKGQQTGFLGAKEFSTFLDRSLTGQGNDDPLAKFKNLGLAATLLLIVAGGFLLNFTPCILPMIPINLAIIGAGRAAKSRMDGFRNGLIYGIGIALAYGTLGLVVVLTGSKFGTLNSNMWFNLVIALVFVVLALGMFDLVNIDLSRFSGSGPASSAGKGVWAQRAVVLSMGIMSALLAGACVAPVVISVILQATNLYAKGSTAGLLLPFLLGVGMALPWPFAGAGLTFLPKPGAWMKYVKYGFGILILGFAFYYGRLAWHAHQLSQPPATAATASGTASAVSAETEAGLLAAIEKSRTTGRPLFVDFHASWCKDCSAMDELVFNQPGVKKHLEDFVSVRYAAEQPNVAPAKPLLDHFNIVGLPTYLVLFPK